VCSDYVDSIYSSHLHKSCAVNGGDGLAFVIHSDRDAGTKALGANGQELGYGGIKNSIAIEFDMWTNVNTQGSNDLFYDHISIHSGSTGPNSASMSSALGYARPVDLADGNMHRVRIRYLPYLSTKYVSAMTANENLTKYLKDNGEGRRIGTLAVFIDNGVENDTPTIAIPLNLSVLLDLPQSLAYVGFTASTGDNWESHDVISWDWCDSGDCLGDAHEITNTDIDDELTIPSGK